MFSQRYPSLAKSRAVHLNVLPTTFIEQHPANLKFSLEYADLDGLDAGALDVWYQAYAGDPWLDMSTTWRKKSYWLETDIYHFSNYAIAF